MGGHSMTYLEPAPGRLPDGVASVAAILPSHYASPDRVAAILGRLGKPEAAEYVRSKMPKEARSRSGDAGEILASRFVEETTG